MYDNVKIVINDKAFATELKENKLLEFTTTVNPKTGEVNEMYVAESQNMKFIVYPSFRVEIKGSLHRYWNNGKHNYNDFTIKNVKETVMDLQNKFNINPITAHIQNLEIGLNINPPFEPNNFLNSLIAYKNIAFDKMRVLGQGKGKQVYLTQYGIKIYNKGLQYGRKEPILRYEKKITTMESLRKEKVYLNDLTNLEFANYCLEHLLKSFNELIVNEKINEDLLTRPERNVYNIAQRTGSWETMSRKQRHSNKAKFSEIIEYHGTQKLKSKVLNLLKIKGQQILRSPIKKGNVLTDIAILKRERFDYLIIKSDCIPMQVLNYSYNNRYCKTCNRDISHQNKLSVYCSEKYFGKAAKQCRNKESNPRNNFKGKIERETAKGLLFDIIPFMKVHYKQNLI